MDLKGTKTEKNLMEAFAGESQARNKYTYYASQAKKDGYVQIAQIFEETAKNEQEHAKLWFKLLHGGAVPTTEVNLQDAANGENFEWTDMYDRMEKEHEARYLKLLERVKGGMVFSSEGDTMWQCSNCGHIVIGKQAPEVCPVCAHAKAYFQRKAENY